VLDDVAHAHTIAGQWQQWKRFCHKMSQKFHTMFLGCPSALGVVSALWYTVSRFTELLVAQARQWLVGCYQVIQQTDAPFNCWFADSLMIVVREKFLMSSSPQRSQQLFGSLLRQLRKRIGMTQEELAAATGYSRTLISAVEQNTRLPATAVVIQNYLPALGLQDEPLLAAQLVELAALARGELLPADFTLNHEQRLAVTREFEEAPRRLPLPPTPLLGREGAIKELVNRLLGHHGRLLTLVGPPGVGKTRLAQAVGAEVQQVYRDGALFVPLAAVTDPTLVAATLVTALKLPDSRTKPPEVRLIEHLRRKELLLILDNFEQLIAAAPFVAELLAECADLRMLVTSRQCLHLRAEQRYAVPPLLLDVAVELFTQRAQAVDVAFELTAEQQPVVTAICQRLDCLPLAIELIAARLDLFSPQQLLTRLQTHALDLITDDTQDLPEHQRTLRRAIQASYALLTERERALFRMLGVFVGGFDLAAVAQFGFDAAELQGLISKSLVHPAVLQTSAANKEGERRFFLLEMLREYAYEQLIAANEAAPLHRRYADYFFNLAATADLYMERREKKIWLERLQDDYGNLRAALAWLIATDAPVAQQLARLLWRFWEASALLSEGRHWLAQALAADISPTPQRAWALWAKAHLTDATVNHQQAQVLAQESLEIFQAQGDQFGCCAALNLLGYIQLNAGQGAQALPYLEQGLAWARQAGDPRCLAQALVSVGDVYLQLGRAPTQILPLLEESAQIYDELDDAQGFAYTYHVKARIHLSVEDYAQAIALGQEALARNRSMGSWLDAAWVTTTLGGAAWFRGDRIEACTYWEEARQFFQAAEEQGGLMEVWYGFARVARYLLEVADATFAQYAFDDTTRLLSVVQKTIDSQPPFLDAVAAEKYRQMLTTLRSHYPESTFAALWVEGQGLTLAAAVTLALTLPVPPVSLDRPPWLQVTQADGCSIAPPNAPMIKTPKTHPAGLTQREVEVLGLLAQRLTHREIAEKLVISRRTVNAHVAAIYSKLGMNTREAAIRFAADHHLL
jgi:predicted ATPase/DNA-binding CsgD family transcriptional regulator/transcriptional regulator with XRE-family HTH domain